MRKKCLPILALLAAVALSGGAAAAPAARPRKASNRAYIAGLVYLDVNRNGWRDAREPGIPDLPIAVDGGATVLTDRDRKSTRLNSSHLKLSRMPSSA